MRDLISRGAAIDIVAPYDEGREMRDALEDLPSAQPYTDAEIQKMQDLESAEIEKAYQLGYEEGKKDAQPERTGNGKWKYIGYMVVECSECNAQLHGLECANFCPNCGAKMEDTP